MNRGAYVRAIHELEYFRGVLKRFKAEVREILLAVDRDAVRTIEWVRTRESYWVQSVRYWEDAVEDARQNLARCREEEEAEEEEADCGPEETALRIAYARLREARENLTVARRWLDRIERVAGEYRNKSRVLESAANETIDQASAFLRERHSYLATYAGVGEARPEYQIASQLLAAPASIEREAETEEAGLDAVRSETLLRRISNLSPDGRAALDEVLAHPLTNGPALFRGLGNPALPEGMAAAIPGALAEILREHPDVAGLFTPLSLRGPGAKAWIANLDGANPSAVAGKAWEVLATAKLLRQSSEGLQIRPDDEIAFGPKCQARYEPQGRLTQELLCKLVAAAPSRWAKFQARHPATARRTVESDLHIGRLYVDGWREIFVDFKYTTAGATYLKPSELLGLAVALATGEIDEAHFVCCNGRFWPVSRARIDDINRLLGRRAIFYHEDLRWEA